MDLQLTDLVAVVTGSSQGLGLASARALVAEGCRVAICARRAEKLSRRPRCWRRKPIVPMPCSPFPPTCRHRKARVAVIDATVARFGRIDILVNNVGKAGGTDIVATADEDWQQAIDQTLYPAIRMSRLVVPHMRRTGGGVILMMASIWGRESGGRMTYNAVKAAQISLAKAMAHQLAARSHPRQQHRTWIDFIRGRHVVDAPARRSAGHRRVHQARDSVRPLWPCRRSRRRRRVSGVAACELDHGRLYPSGRRPKARRF